MGLVLSGKYSAEGVNDCLAAKSLGEFFEASTPFANYAEDPSRGVYEVCMPNSPRALCIPTSARVGGSAVLPLLKATAHHCPRLVNRCTTRYTTTRASPCRCWLSIPQMISCVVQSAPAALSIARPHIIIAAACYCVLPRCLLRQPRGTRRIESRLLRSNVREDLILKKPGTLLLRTKRGGHVAFCEGWLGQGSYLLRVSLDFLEAARSVRLEQQLTKAGTVGSY